jgi:hypothetical protein
MSDDLFADKLEWFKQNEKPEVVLLVAEDEPSVRLIVAWTNTAVHRAKRATKLTSGSENDVWDWLWTNAHYSLDDLVERSALPRHGFDRRLATLVGNRVLYPDGTVNSYIQRYLREKVLRLFDSKRGKGAGKAG